MARWRLMVCRYLNHPLWWKADGSVWCYREGRYVA